MADGAVIGALRVVLGADTASFDQGLKQSQVGLAAFGAAVSTGLAAVAAAAAAAAVAMGVALTRTIDDMDKLNKTSQKLGIPVEQLSALAYAADLADVSFEQLSKGVGKLSKNMVDAAAKPTGDAANAFRALGVSVLDSNGKLKSSEVVLGDLAEAFASAPDGPKKTALAMAVFGKAGADLIPLLNGGRDSLNEMTAEAKAFGAIVSTSAGKQAEAFNDNLTRLGYAVKGLFVQTAEKLLPTLVNVSAGMVEWAKNSGILDTALTVISNTIKGLVTGGIILGAVFKSIAEYVSTVSSALGLLLQGEFSKAWTRIQTGVSSVGDTAKATFGTVKDLWTGATTGAAAAAAATEDATKKKKDFNTAALAGKNAIDSFIDSQNKGLASAQAEIKTFGMLAGAREAAKIQLQAEAIALANRMALSPKQQADLDLLKQKTSDYALTLAGLNLAQSNLTPAQLLQQEQAKVNALLNAGKISAEDYALAMENAAERSGATWQNAGLSMMGGFQQLSAAFAKNNKVMGIASKAFGIGQAIINAQIAATKALALYGPTPLGFAAVAGAIAQGAASVAAISAQGFAMGGLVRGPGTGQSDSIPANLSNGEFVMNADATRQHLPELESMNAGGGGRGAGGGTTIIRLITDELARPFVEKLIPALNSALRDGHRIELSPA